MPRQGTATLPLHNGSAPRWLFDRMVDLGGAIAEVIIDEYGQEELLNRLADPYWFQAFGCVLGFDWHSSGVTTTTMGALKEALDPAEHGVFVAGGKGATSRQTPDEIRAAEIGLSPGRRDELTSHSKLSATVDDACVQDTYTLYHHTMVVTEDGDWAVVQQGMNDDAARRYHWLSDSVEEFVVEPQSAIASHNRDRDVLDLTAADSGAVRDISVDLVQDDPSRFKRYATDAEQTGLDQFTGTSQGVTTESRSAQPSLHLPHKHALGRGDLTQRSVDQLERAYEYQPDSYRELAELDGIGRGSLRALALVAELIHDAEASHEDPAKYAYAHGGKDGTPQPVARERYDRSIEFMESVLHGAEPDQTTTQQALDRLATLR